MYWILLWNSKSRVAPDRFHWAFFLCVFFSRKSYDRRWEWKLFNLGFLSLGAYSITSIAYMLMFSEMPIARFSPFAALFGSVALLLLIFFKQKRSSVIKLRSYELRNSTTYLASSSKRHFYYSLDLLQLLGQCWIIMFKSLAIYSQFECSLKERMK